MKLSATIALFSMAIFAYAETCNSPAGVNYCGGGRECGDGPGIYTCSPAGQIVAIACCGTNGCRLVNGQPFCV
ncbi:hypothetical protein V496_01727 [Pseudogymnoascus sp. VKM F-4515 (FW-2607)]|nr:hypothetical protein V496_01727 [Pseudogymnoascus sp. VKM F-4515 (FW-2607)]